MVYQLKGDLKMKYIIFAAEKGGVGKSTLGAFLSNCLSLLGHRILRIDGDKQNTTTYYYDIPDDICEKSNIYNLIKSKNVIDNIVSADLFTDIIPAYPTMELLEDSGAGLENVKLRELLKPVNDKYDYCIIDTSPHWHRLTTWIIEAATNSGDLIISPSPLNLVNLKSLVHFKMLMIQKCTNFKNIINNWRVIYNYYKAPRVNGKGKLSEMITVFENEIELNGHILKTKFPLSSLVDDHFDRKIAITNSSKKQKLYNAILSLSEEISGNKISKIEKVS